MDNLRNQLDGSVHLGRRRMLSAASGALALAAVGARAQGDVFPNKPVKIFTPFPSGSGPDMAQRMVAERLARKWHQPVIVENRPGGNGFIAIDAFRRSPSDGHALVQLDNTHLTSHPHLFARLPYEPQVDLEPIRPLFRAYHFVVVGTGSAYKTLPDLIDAARRVPGKMTYASPFHGSPAHLGAALLASSQGIEMVNVPFKETSQLFAAVATGDVDWVLGTAASAGALEKAGRLRFIALAAPKRMANYPQTPATAENPVTAGYEVAAWTALFAQRGTPLALRERIGADVAQALAAPEIVERFRVVGYDPLPLDAPGTAKMIASETRMWGDVIRSGRITLIE